MSISLLVMCLIRLDDGSVKQVLGHETKEISQDKSLVVFEELNQARIMNTNDCLYVDGAKVEAIYAEQMKAVDRLNNGNK